MLKNFVLLMGLLFSTHSALAQVDISPAIGGSTENVSPTEYKDWIVHLEIESNDGTYTYCGGGLIGGEFIISASHCFENSSGFVVVRQGVDLFRPVALSYREFELFDTRNNLTYAETITYLQQAYQQYVEGIFTDNGLQISNPIMSISAEEIQQLKNDPNKACCTQIQDFDYRDLAIIKLAEPIIQISGALVTPRFELESGEYNLSPDETITFKGWGATNVGGPIADNLLKANFSYSFSHMFAEVNGYRECTQNDSDCRWTGMPFFEISSALVEQSVLPGDSGTPLYKGDEMYGTASYYGVNNYQSGFNEFEPYTEWFIRTIGKVAFPSKLIFVESDFSQFNGEFRIPVQNFTDSTITLDTENLTFDDNSYFEARHECPSQLSSLEGCMLVISTKSGTFAESQLDYLYLNPDLMITVSTGELTDTRPDENTDETVEQGGSGGSVGFTWLGFLIAVRLIFNKGR
ncbi:trypsin-like serine protease [Vibrio sp. ZSDZ34]|uniref:Trypsin-like serine protease n=1 Tax=Vibrio gelatinilyticus TaxID=2893468 RepID=A0A9X2AVT6_9VIBR|nr:trypsin-like serine protease [Vibrio gelatinilyticus]